MTAALFLPESVRAWRTEAFPRALKAELEKLGLDELPLQQGLSTSSVALDDELQIIILSAEDKGSHIDARAGIFYTGVIAGCSCADDPTPLERVNEYCEIDIYIDSTTGKATIKLSPG